MAADLNYVSPLTSDLTDYYTKQEVDELQQGDVDKFATQAQVIAGDNTVKGWVVSQDYLKEHQSLENYATKDYVNTVVSEIEVEGVSIEVVARLPQPQDASANTIYLVLSSASESGNIYDEWIYVPDAEDFELIGNTSSGIVPDLSEYATKTWVGEQGFLTEHQSLLGYATEAYVNSVVEALDIPDVSNFVEESELAAVAKSGSYDDLSNKPSIPTVPTNVSAFTNDAGYLTEHQSLANYATKSELNTKANATELTSLANSVSQKANAADLATVATSGSYNDLSDKPSIPSAPDLTPYAIKAELSSVATSGDYEDLTNKPVIPTLPTLATVATSGSYNDLTDKPTIPTQEKIYAYAPRFASRLGYNNTIDNVFIVTANTKDKALEAIKKGQWFKVTSGAGYDITPVDLGFSNSDTLTQFGYSAENGFTSISGRAQISVFRNLLAGYIAPKTFFRCELTEYQDLLNIQKYSNTTSGLTATTVQGAIDELAASSGGGIAVQDVIDEFNTNGLTLDDGTANKVEILNSDITATLYQSGTEQGVDWSVDTYSTTAPDAITFGKSVSENNTQTQGLSMGIHPDRNYETLEVDIVDVANNYNDTRTLAFLSDIPAGYEISENYNATNKALTLSVVASRA